MQTETKQQRYNKKMNSQGFKRRKIWVHDEDWPEVQAYMRMLRKRRENKL